MSDQWYGDTSKSNPLCRCFHTLSIPILYDKTRISQRCTKLSHSKVSTRTDTSIHIPGYRTCFVASPPWASPFEEPLVGTPSYCFKAILCMTFLTCLTYSVGGSIPYVLWTYPYLSCSIRWTFIIYAQWVGPLPLTFDEVDPYSTSLLF